jgi:hypothetical protein
VLDVVGVEPDAALIDDWRRRIERGRAFLGWDGMGVARVHADGASLAVAAPVDQLFTATELNEWALAATLLARDPARWAGLEAAMIRDAAESATPPAIPPGLDDAAAMTRLKHLSQLAARPDLVALIDAAHARDLPWLLDEDVLTLGAGIGHIDLPLDALPPVGDIGWPSADVGSGSSGAFRAVGASSR